MKMHLTSLLIIVAVFVGLASAGPNAHAATITVNNTNDSGAGSLRQALADASDGDTIDFSVTGTILLNSDQLTVDKSVTISGPGANVLTVKSAGLFRVLTVNSGKTVTISGLTVTNGHLSGVNQGAGIFNSGTLTVIDCTISNNTAQDNGGGIRNDGSLTVSGSTFTGNTSGGGGAINSTGPYLLSNSTISGNHSTGNGGGITIDGGTTTISNSTVSGNSAPSFNSGGGIFRYGPGDGTLNLNSSIVAKNTAGCAPDIDGTVSSGDYNLVENTSGTTLTGTHNITGVDPMLGPLASYGGPTAMHILLTGSPAIDQGKNFSDAATDQRGAGSARTVDGAAANATGGDGTDIGAFERQIGEIDPTPGGAGGVGGGGYSRGGGGGRGGGGSHGGGGGRGGGGGGHGGGHRR